MDPNSAHQLWSKWTIVVRPGLQSAILNPRSFAEVKANVARFMRKAFGSGSQLRIRQFPKAYVIELMTEGAPVHDPALVAYFDGAFAEFFRSGFGPATRTTTKVRFLAGDRQDGRPREQLLIIPTLTVSRETFSERTH